MSKREPKLFAGNSNRKLAEDIAADLGWELGAIDVGPYPNKETRVEILESVRKHDVFIIQSTCPPTNEYLMELLVMLDAFRRASVGHMTVVMPYFGYAKQDKKKTGREPITARLVANLLTAAGADRIVTLDLHSDQIQGFFDIPVDALHSTLLMSNYFKSIIPNNNMVVVSPDVGGTKRARNFANRLHAGLAIIDKDRPHYSKAKAMNVIGDVAGKTCIIVDDFIDTGGSMVEAVRAIHEQGAEKIYVYCTHPLLTSPAVDRLKELDIVELVTTDTIPIPPEKQFKKLKVLSTAHMFADTIQRISEGESVSALFQMQG